MQGSELSGGDRIFIEFCKRWSKKIDIKVITSTDGWNVCVREGLKNFKHLIWVLDKYDKFGYFINYLYRTVMVILKSFFIKNQKKSIIYSTSDFWPDSISAIILKLRNHRLRWVAGFFLFAPKPWSKDSIYKGTDRLIGFFYWLTQIPIYWLIKKYADFVFITSQPDVKKFLTKTRKKDRILVIKGGIDLTESKKYFILGEIIPLKQRKYDACFVGRFHYQKGVLELIDIWKMVVEKRKNAKLVMIGTGSLMEEVRKKIKKFNLLDNIELSGFKNGKEKYEIFKQSKIVVHPATYDSGGMAAAEAMAWGLPGLSFDLESLKTYYPKGMIKIPCYEKKTYANTIVKLVEDEEFYNRISNEAISLANKWDWDLKAEKIINLIIK